MKLINRPDGTFPAGLQICYEERSGRHQAETLLRKLARQAGLIEERFNLKKLSSGKPVGEIADTTIGVGVSHSNEIICCGIYLHGELGLDVERKDREVTSGLRERILNTHEKNRVSTIETIRLWTMKEAVLKMTGTGLRTAMKNVEILDSGHNLYTARVSGHHIRLISLSLENHWLSVAFTDN